MKKFLTLFLAVLLLSGLLTCTASATEPSTTVNDQIANNQIAVHALADYIEVHTMDECREILLDMMESADSQNNDESAAPFAIVHCQSSAGIGRYVEQFVGKITTEERQNCVHGAVGMIDVCNVTRYVYRQYCTLCSYQTSYEVKEQTPWVCKKP